MITIIQEGSVRKRTMCLYCHSILEFDLSDCKKTNSERYYTNEVDGIKDYYDLKCPYCGKTTQHIEER